MVYAIIDFVLVRGLIKVACLDQGSIINGWEEDTLNIGRERT